MNWGENGLIGAGKVVLPLPQRGHACGRPPHVDVRHAAVDQTVARALNFCQIPHNRTVDGLRRLPPPGASIIGRAAPVPIRHRCSRATGVDVTDADGDAATAVDDPPLPRLPPPPSPAPPITRGRRNDARSARNSAYASSTPARRVDTSTAPTLTRRGGVALLGPPGPGTVGGTSR